MENYSIEPLPAPDPKRQRITRLLLFVWGALALVLVAILCYTAFAAFRPPPKEPVYVNDVSVYAPNSINKYFINAEFFDPASNLELETLPLQIVRGAGDDFTIFFARSANPTEAVLIPRQCVVDWDESLMQFLELCGGSRWTRQGAYVAGPAPRGLDKFPAHVQDGKLYMDLELIQGAPRP